MGRSGELCEERPRLSGPGSVAFVGFGAWLSPSVSGGGSAQPRTRGCPRRAVRGLLPAEGICLSPGKCWPARD